MLAGVPSNSYTLGAGPGIAWDDSIYGSGFDIASPAATTSSFSLSSYLTFDTSVWHHIVAVGNSAGITFFIDGLQVGTSTFVSLLDVVAVGNVLGGAVGRKMDHGKSYRMMMKERTH